MILTAKDRQFLKRMKIAEPYADIEAIEDGIWLRALRAAEDWSQAKRVLARCGVRMADALRKLSPTQQERFYRGVLSKILAENPFEDADR
jgi:hypothetical protein